MTDKTVIVVLAAWIAGSFIVSLLLGAVLGILDRIKDRNQ